MHPIHAYANLIIMNISMSGNVLTEKFKANANENWQKCVPVLWRIPANKDENKDESWLAIIFIF